LTKNLAAPAASLWGAMIPVSEPRCLSRRPRVSVLIVALVLTYLEVQCFVASRVSLWSGGWSLGRTGTTWLLRRATKGELEAMKLTDLKEICRSNSLPVSGTKAQLVERILAEEDSNLEDDEEEDEDEPEKVTAKAAPAPARPKPGSTTPSGYIEETEISGPKGKPIIAGDTIYLLARTGKYLEYPEHREDPRARAVIKGTRQALEIQKKGGGAIQSGDTISLRCHLGVYLDFQGTAVRARKSEAGEWQQIRITNEDHEGSIRTGDVIFLRGHQDNVLDVEKENVKCRWPDEGKWQRLVIEK